MDGFIANSEGRTDGQVRRAFKDGREYLVAPLSLLVPGVLSGSQGPIYYPPDEVARGPQQWDGMPLLAYHPQAVNGAHVSANHAGVLDKQGIGFVHKSHIDALRRGALRAEGWFDVERTKAVDPRIHEALQNNRPIELSTGLFIQRREPALPGANHNGQGYEWVGRDYRPDHVAILPDQVGACSIRDGCGVLVNRLVVNSSGNTQPVTLQPGDRFEVVRVGDETLYRLVGNESSTEPVANTWSDAARAAALEARRARASEKDSFEKEGLRFASETADLASKHAGEVGTPYAHSRAAYQHHEAAQRYQERGLEDAAAAHTEAAHAHENAVWAGEHLTPPPSLKAAKPTLGQKLKSAFHLNREGGETEEETKQPTAAKPSVEVKPPKTGSAQAGSEEEEYSARLNEGVAPSTPSEGATMNEYNAFLLYNARWDQDARDKLSKEAPEDFAGPHQSFPIRSQEDVDHAARLIGHADDPAAVKSKIKTIAKRKGLSPPDSWTKDEPAANYSPDETRDSRGRWTESPSSFTGADGRLSDETKASLESSKAANKLGTKGSHQLAAHYHEVAAKAAEKEGDARLAAVHREAASYHTEKAKYAPKLKIRGGLGDYHYTKVPSKSQPPQPKRRKIYGGLGDYHYNQNGESAVTNQLIQELIANCSCERTKTTLQAIVDNSIEAPDLTANSPLKAPENMNDGELKNHHQRVMAEVMKRHAGVDADPDQGADAEGGAGNGYSEEGEGAGVANDTEMHAFDGPKGSGKEVQAGGKGTKDEYPKATQNMRAIIGKLKNSGLTAQEIALVGNSLGYAANAERETKLGVARQVVANAHLPSKEARQTLGNALMRMSLPELRQLATGQRQAQPAAPLYQGNSPAFNGAAIQGGMPGGAPAMVPVTEQPVTLNYREMASPELLKRLDSTQQLTSANK